MSTKVISWDDIRRGAETNFKYIFDGGIVTLRQRHLDQWRQHPDGVFAVESRKGRNGQVTHYLGQFYETKPPAR